MCLIGYSNLLESGIVSSDGSRMRSRMLIRRSQWWLVELRRYMIRWRHASLLWWRCLMVRGG